MTRAILLHGLVILTILVLSFSPLISAMIAGTIANHYGCDLDEGSVHPCIVNGQDIGDTLYTLGVLGWLALGTIPLGMMAIGVYLAAVLIFYLARWILRRRRAASQSAG
jgi:predicted permease